MGAFEFENEEAIEIFRQVFIERLRTPHSLFNTISGTDLL
jgi:hypothetical protein